MEKKKICKKSKRKTKKNRQKIGPIDKSKKRKKKNGSMFNYEGTTL